MRLSSRIAFGISEMADRKAKKGKYLFAKRLYCLATVLVRRDIRLMKELLKQLEEAK